MKPRRSAVTTVETEAPARTVETEPAAPAGSASSIAEAIRRELEASSPVKERIKRKLKSLHPMD